MLDFETDSNTSVQSIIDIEDYQTSLKFEVIVYQMQQVQDSAERVNATFATFKNDLNQLNIYMQIYWIHNLHPTSLKRKEKTSSARIFPLIIRKGLSAIIMMIMIITTIIVTIIITEKENRNKECNPFGAAKKEFGTSLMMVVEKRLEKER
jgi:hypothetical protein